jgi:transposase-like protein
MGKYRKQYDEDFKKNAVKPSYASPRSVKEIAADLGIHENMLYNWRRKYTADGDETKYAGRRKQVSSKATGRGQNGA